MWASPGEQFVSAKCKIIFQFKIVLITGLGDQNVLLFSGFWRTSCVSNQLTGKQGNRATGQHNLNWIDRTRFGSVPDSVTGCQCLYHAQSLFLTVWQAVSACTTHSHCYWQCDRLSVPVPCTVTVTESVTGCQCLYHAQSLLLTVWQAVSACTTHSHCYWQCDRLSMRAPSTVTVSACTKHSHCACCLTRRH